MNLVYGRYGEVAEEVFHLSLHPSIVDSKVCKLLQKHLASGPEGPYIDLKATRKAPSARRGTGNGQRNYSANKKFRPATYHGAELPPSANVGMHTAD